jgi:hypothetical protein
VRWREALLAEDQRKGELSEPLWGGRALNEILANERDQRGPRMKRRPAPLEDHLPTVNYDGRLNLKRTKAPTFLVLVSVLGAGVNCESKMVDGALT